MSPKTIYRKEQALLASLLRELRLSANMTQAECAEILGKTQSYVSTVESGRQRLDLLELRDYSAACGVSLLNFVKRYEAALKKIGD